VLNSNLIKTSDFLVSRYFTEHLFTSRETQVFHGTYFGKRSSTCLFRSTQRAEMTSVIPTSVMKDFHYNGSVFHSPVISLCFITVTTSLTPVSHTPDLQLHQISPIFPNSLLVFSSVAPFFGKIIGSSQRLQCVRVQGAHSSERSEDCLCNLIGFCTRRRQGDL
jgi:hypothetical protein